jgi:tetraacyldisaccharide 4'-kinase
VISQSAATRWIEVVSGRDRRAQAVLARAALLPLSWLYGLVIRVYRSLYHWGILRTTTLRCHVIGVGNLTVGGTGKSTTVRWLARRLSQTGRRVAVLSYGYRPKKAVLGARCSVLGREGSALKERRAPSAERGSEATLVVSDGERVLVPVAESGDEPRMLADALPRVPVLIGPRRVASGARAVDEFGAEVCVLDDSFQYWRLRKDLEIVLVDAAVPLGYGYLLPRGLLREPPRALGRADVVLLMNGHRVPAERRQELLARLARLAPRTLLLEGRHRPTGLRDLFAQEALPLAWLNGRGVIALSSLGNPEGFEQTLRELAADVVETRRFPDHHRYTREEAIVSCGLQGASSEALPPAEALVTTAKDAPKLLEALGGVAVGQPLPTMPVLVLEIDLDLADDGAARLDRVLRRYTERD